MAEVAVSFAVDQLLPLLREEANLLRGIHKEFADIKDELESIQAFLKDADRRAAAEGDNKNEGIKTWVKQAREAAFRIEDIIDEYMFYVGQHPRDPGCTTSLNKIAHLIKILMPRHQIASEIHDIKLSVRGIKQRSEMYSFEQGSSSSTGCPKGQWHDPRVASIYIEEAEVVGLEAPREELAGWLGEEMIERTVVAVVGMGGLGKTTLARKVFDSKKVTGSFDCSAWITVSQSYTVERLLREMLEQFSRERQESPPKGVSKMDRNLLIHEVRKYLQQKRYVVVFDDVWNVNFWGEIEVAAFDNNKKSRILITTRSMDVAEFCKKSSVVHVHNLQPLTPEESWKLFCKKTFQFEFDGCCPEELVNISSEIVQKCKGLPLAIVAMAGLLSTKQKSALEWKKLSQNMSSELDMNPHLSGITKILALSYDDLPYCLKSCFLYFGVYPQDYIVNSERLIWQWVAEGFVKDVKGKTLEEVAEQYLTELIRRSLVQISFEVDGKVESCGVHDLVHEMIVRKMEDLSFCHCIGKDDQSTFNGIIRRLAIATNSNDLVNNIKSSHIRSLHIFTNKKLQDSFVRNIPMKYRRLKVLNFRDVPLGNVPENLGNLFHLRYLSLRNTNIQSLPKSIGKLQNLETLDLRQTQVRKIPREVRKLKKLRHLIAYHLNYKEDFVMSWDWDKGIQMNDGIGSLTSLQTLCLVEADHGGVELIRELEKLTQLRLLWLNHVKQEYGSALCVSISEMHHLESLHITAIVEDEVIDIQFTSPPAQLQQLRLRGKLEKLPEWIQELQYLVRLSLSYSKLNHDPLESLKSMPNLMYLLLYDAAYEGETLHFQLGGLQRLKELTLRSLYGLNSIVIDKGALPALKRFTLRDIPQLKEVPFGIHHLENLEVLDVADMPNEFDERIDPAAGQQRWIIQHVPIVYIRHKLGSKFSVFDTRIIHHSRCN
ncbi:hypothetical protein RJT34_00425 [Clitoria ternatea]|uniref:Uncharacterized protein n=1 Tax=Clitoria ternatea TaxID=43366 RepID=A0AAN9Q2P7_CLITE